MEEVSKEKVLRKQEVNEQTLFFASGLFSVTYRLLLQWEMLLFYSWIFMSKKQDIPNMVISKKFDPPAVQTLLRKGSQSEEG